MEPNISNLSLYPFKPGHFIQKNKINRIPVGVWFHLYTQNVTTKNQDPMGACKQHQRTTGTCMFTSLFLCQCQIWAHVGFVRLRRCHISEALMPPASLNRCAFLERGFYILRNPIGKIRFFFVFVFFTDTPEVTHTCSNWASGKGDWCTSNDFILICLILKIREGWHIALEIYLSFFCCHIYTLCLCVFLRYVAWQRD